MSNTRTLVDPLGPIKTWLRAQSLDVGSRVHIGDPTGETLPYLSLALVDGAVDPGEAQLQVPRIQVCAQGATDLEASDAIWDVCTVIDGARGLLTSALRCGGTRLVLGPVQRADAMGPRYLAEHEWTVSAT